MKFYGNEIKIKIIKHLELSLGNVNAITKDN